MVLAKNIGLPPNPVINPYKKNGYLLRDYLLREIKFLSSLDKWRVQVTMAVEVVMHNAKGWLVVIAALTLGFGVVNMTFPVLGTMIIAAVGGIIGRVIWGLGTDD
jgi:hypothetical protein